MQDAMRIGAAALGGYALGRTKKAKAAISLALWLSGRGRPRDIARDQAVKALRSERGQELLAQLRGPALTAGKQAAVSLYEKQAGRLSGTLERRTKELTAGLGETAKQGGTTAGKAKKTAERLSERRRGPARRSDEVRRSERRRGRTASAARDEDEYDSEEPERYEAEEQEPEEEEAGEGEPEYEDEYEDEEEEAEEEQEELAPRPARRRRSA
ncbi:MAG TPA: hypothetical protein VE441_05280 [Mycobacterium sp.]|nr:hypothetical protein [Mycobacterium sp.]